MGSIGSQSLVNVKAATSVRCKESSNISPRRYSLVDCCDTCLRAFRQPFNLSLAKRNTTGHGASCRLSTSETCFCQNIVLVNVPISTKRLTGSRGSIARSASPPCFWQQKLTDWKDRFTRHGHDESFEPPRITKEPMITRLVIRWFVSSPLLASRRVQFLEFSLPPSSKAWWLAAINGHWFFTVGCW